MGANLRRHSHCLGDRRFKQIDLHAAQVVIHPLFKNGNQKRAPVFRVNRPVGNNGVEVAGTRAAATGERDGVILPELRRGLFEINRFDAGIKLYIGRTQFAGDEAVHFQRKAGVGPVYCYQRVKWDAVTLQGLNARHHFVKCRFAATGHAIAVMQFSWAINRESHQKLMFF